MGIGSIFPEGQWCAQQDAARQIGRKDLGPWRQGPPLLEYLLCFESRTAHSDIPADPEHLRSSMGRQADTIKVSKATVQRSGEPKRNSLEKYGPAPWEGLRLEEQWGFACGRGTDERSGREVGADKV